MEVTELKERHHTGDVDHLEKEMEIEEALKHDLEASNADDELLLLLSMGADQYCQMAD